MMRCVLSHGKFGSTLFIAALSVASSGFTSCDDIDDIPTQTPTIDVRELTRRDIHAGFADGTLTCERLAQAFVDRILLLDAASVDGRPAINSMVTIDPNVMAAARELDRAYAESGLTGSLHCIPVVLKDNHDTSDMRTTGGARVLLDSVPPRDAFVVARIREAGALILGKANMDEFARSVSGNSALKQVGNPYDTWRSPGGSSSGSGAALAANFSVLATGTDTCMSLRYPASYNSLVSIRPSIGLVSQSGLIPFSDFTDTAGPMARTVADMAALLDVMAAPDPDDAQTQDPTRVQPSSYLALLDAGGLSGKRIGVLRRYRLDGGDMADAFGEDAGTIAIVEQAIADMEAQGATIVDDVEIEQTLGFAELASNLFLVNTEELVEAYLAAVGAGFDLQGMIDSGMLGESGADLFNLALLPVFTEFTDLESLRQGIIEQRGFIEGVMDLMDLDAIVYPSAPNGPPQNIADLTQIDVQTNCHLSASSGMPAMVVPAGFTAEGLPVGIEMMARKWDESTLIEIGYAYEKTTRHRQPPAEPSVPSAPPMSIEDFNRLVE